MTRILLAVLAIPVVAAVAVLVAIARLARQLELSGTAGPSPRDASAVPPDDSEVVGMPTTWPLVIDEPVHTESTRTLHELYQTWNGPGWYVELAPTSRN